MGACVAAVWNSSNTVLRTPTAGRMRTLAKRKTQAKPLTGRKKADAALESPGPSPAADPTLTINALESHLWEVANGFLLPDGHWSDVSNKAAAVGTALQTARCAIEKADDKHLFGEVGDAEWANKEQVTEPLLKDLLEYFSSITPTSCSPTRPAGSQVMVSRVVADIDAIVKPVRLDGWQWSTAGDRDVTQSLRKAHLQSVIRRFKTGHASAPENRPPGGGYWVEESSSSDLRARGFGSVRAVCAGLPVGGGIAAA